MTDAILFLTFVIAYDSVGVIIIHIVADVLPKFVYSVWFEDLCLDMSASPGPVFPKLPNFMTVQYQNARLSL